MSPLFLALEIEIGGRNYNNMSGFVETPRLHARRCPKRRAIITQSIIVCVSPAPPRPPTHFHKKTHMHKHAHIYTYAQTHMHTLTHRHTDKYTRTHTSTHTHYSIMPVSLVKSKGAMKTINHSVVGT